MYLFVLLAAMANALFGFEMSAISVSKLHFAPEYNVSSTSTSYGFVASANAIGATISSPAAGILQDRLGRRITLIVACVIYMTSVAVSFTSASFIQLCCGRLITGLSIGLFSSTAPLYIAELSPPAVRGKLVTVNQVRGAPGGGRSTSKMPADDDP